MLYINVMNMYDFSQEVSLYAHACDYCIQRKQQNMELNSKQTVEQNTAANISDR